MPTEHEPDFRATYRTLANLAENAPNLFVATANSQEKKDPGRFPVFLDPQDEPGSGVWSQARRYRIRRLLREAEIYDFLDVGCGDGSQLSLHLARDGFRILGLEPVEQRAASLAAHGIPVVVGNLSTFHELNGPRVPNIVMFDSLQYTPDDMTALSIAREVLQPGGKLIVSVPCYQAFFSDYDHAIGNLRRYDPKEFLLRTERSGFQLLTHEFLFSFLSPGLFLRKFSAGDPLRNSRRLENVINHLGPLIYSLVCIEQSLRVPFGLSLLAVFRSHKQD